MLSTCNIKGVMRNCNDTAPKVICSVIGVIVKYDVTGAFTKYKVKQKIVQYTVTRVL